MSRVGKFWTVLCLVCAGQVLAAERRTDANAPCRITTGYFDDDEHPDYVLENGLVKATFSSGKGGKGTSLIYKPADAELVRCGHPTEGALFELFWIQRKDQDAGIVDIGRINAALFQYSSRISGRSDDDVRAEFAIAPKFQGLDGWRYKHSVILKRGSPTLKVIAHASTLAEGDAVDAGVWFRNCFWVQKEFVDPHRIAMMVDGKLELCTVPGNAPQDWPSQPVAYPFTGVYGMQSGVGVVMKVDTQSLGEASCQYCWATAKHGGLITLEWMTHQNRYRGHWRRPETARGPLWHWELTVFDKDTYRGLPKDYHPICAALIDPAKAAAVRPAQRVKAPRRDDPFLYFSKAYRTRTIKDLLEAVPKLDDRVFSLFPKNVSVRERARQVWGEPLIGGPLRTIGRLRAIETESTYLPMFVRSKRGPLHPQVEERFRKALDGDWELVVLRSGAPWEKLGEEVRAKIIEGVKGGRGLITVRSLAKGALAELVEANRVAKDAEALGRLAALATFRKVSTHVPSADRDHYGAILRLARVGAGRVAVLNDEVVYLPRCYRPLNVTGEPFTWRLWEYDHALVARAAHWAARGWASSCLSDLRIERTPEGRHLCIGVAGEGTGTAAVTLRDWDTRVEHGPKPVVVREGTARVAVPSLKSGKHIAEVILRDARGRAPDWGSATFTVPEGQATIALSMDKPHYRLGDTMQASVAVRGELPADGGLVRLRIMDSEERVFYRAQADVAAEKPAATFEIRTSDFPFYRAYLEATLDGNTATGLACASQAAVNILHPVERDFVLDSWGAGSTRGYDALRMNRLGRKLGFTHLQTVRFVGRHPQFVSVCDAIMAANMRPSLYGAGAYLHDRDGKSYAYPPLCPPGRGNACKVGPDRVRKPCLTSPDGWALFQHNLEQYAHEFTSLGVVHNYLQDEGALDKWGGVEEPRHELCLSATCMAGFREFLKKEYPNLDALNEDWEADFATWEDVVPATYAEIEGQKNFAPWMLHRRFRDGVYAAAIRRMGTMMAAFSPSLRTGMSGTGGLTPYTNRDYSQYVPAMRAIQRYSSPEIIRSFKKPGTVVTRWCGYDRWNTNELRHRYDAWNSFIQGENGISFYTFKATLPGNYGMFWPDDHLREVGRWLMDVSRELSRGLTRLMLRGERQEDGIALVYSPRSVHVGYALRSLRWKRLPGHTAGLGQVLTDLGLQYHILSSEEITAGELARGKYRAILTSASCTLDKEAEAIREFVRDGGLLVADTRPAFVSPTGRVSGGGRLDDVFGVKASEMSPVGEMVSIGSLKAWLCEEGLKPTGATALYRDQRGLAVSFSNAFGKGRAVLLNFNAADYAKTVPTGVAGETSAFVEGQKIQKRALRAVYRNILAQQGITPRVMAREVGSDEPHLADVEAVVYEVGKGVAMVGLLKKPYCSGPAFRKELRHTVEVSFPRRAHVYDTRRGNYLGRTQTVEASIDTAIGEVYALLPYRVEGLRVALPERVAGGELVEGSIALEAPGVELADHVFHVEVVDPAGEEEVLYRRNLDAPGGRATLRLLLPFGALAGEWKIVIRDALTGLTTTETLRVGRMNGVTQP